MTQLSSVGSQCFASMTRIEMITKEEEEDRDSFIYKEKIQIQDKKIRCSHSGRRVFVALGNPIKVKLKPKLENRRQILLKTKPPKNFCLADVRIFGFRT